MGEGLHESKTNLLWETTEPARAELGKPPRPLTGGQGGPPPSDPLVTTAGVTSYERSLYDAWDWSHIASVRWVDASTQRCAHTLHA